MKNGWIWVPVAGVLGLIVGAWGPREELREREKKAAEEKVKAAEEARTSRGAFKSFAQMVNIPDEARRPRRRGQQKRPSKTAVVVSTNAAPACCCTSAVCLPITESALWENKRTNLLTF